MPRPHHGRGREEAPQAAQELRAADGDAREATGPTRCAGRFSSSQRAGPEHEVRARDGVGGDARPPAQGLERLLVLRDLRAHRRAGTERAPPPTERGDARPLGARRARRDRARRARGVREPGEPHGRAAPQAFVDALSNWYVRRSRPRFWAGGSARTSAPRSRRSTRRSTISRACSRRSPPSSPDILYRRLVLPFQPDALPSVHLVPYPKERKERQDEELRKSMGLARDLVALGLRVRNESKLKVRQPLQEAIVVLGGGEKLDRFTDAIREELNVKEVADDRRALEVRPVPVVPNFKALGPKLGKDLPPLQEGARGRGRREAPRGARGEGRDHDRAPGRTRDAHPRRGAGAPRGPRGVRRRERTRDGWSSSTRASPTS